MQSCSAPLASTPPGVMQSCSHAMPPLLHDKDSPRRHAVMQSCSAPWGWMNRVPQGSCKKHPL
eukprot:2379551-Amphidinium_carterae.1